MKKWFGRGILAAVLLGCSAFLLKGDVWTFWTWYLLAGVMGLAAMPVTGFLFQDFEDRGWVFSKVLAVAVTGFLTWLLVSVKILRFTAAACVGVSAACALACVLLFVRQTKKGFECFPVERLSLIWREEILFFAAFLMWTYLAGFHPAAYGTEKFMDYGFMEAMMRSPVLPPRDLWYSQGYLNYYYGGQYFAVFLTKLSGSRVAVTYNLMRTFVAGLAFVMPFSLVYQMMSDRLQWKSEGMRRWIPSAAGVTAGMAVSVAGNMHYVVYAVVKPFVEKLRGIDAADGYWFPDSTRYIGYQPDVPDKTIHEFPCYSFVLGDLHAHVVNILFVLLCAGILYAWMRRRLSGEAGETTPDRFWRRQLLMPHLLLTGLLLGMFQWTNYWDFVIYFVVAGGTILFVNIAVIGGKPWKTIAVTLAQAAELLVEAFVVILPFNLRFKTMVQGVALARNHSLPHQLLILWGLPVCVVVLFLIAVLWEKRWKRFQGNLRMFMRSIRVPDLFAVIMGLCAIGLVLIPELVYVRDIYENGNARANTMFKLTYQAYILFGMTMGYVLFRLLVVSRQKVFKFFSVVGMCLLISTCGYFGNSVRAWFGEVWRPSGYQGLNATAFLETDFPEDAAAIRWLRTNIRGVPVVLEANGDSYTAFDRVSAMTGLPTILGWYVHEWLWRNDVGDLNQKSADVQTIYTSQDEETVRKLLEQYRVSYVFVGAREKEKYGADLNQEIFRKLGSVVFQDETSGTCIWKITR